MSEKTPSDNCCGTAGENGAEANASEGAGGFDMAEMMEKCPCGSVLKNRWAAFAIFSALGLMLLISQIGGILGIIAFIRTF